MDDVCDTLSINRYTHPAEENATFELLLSTLVKVVEEPSETIDSCQDQVCPNDGH